MKLFYVVLPVLCTTSLFSAKPFFENEIIAQLDCIHIGTATTGIEGRTVHDTFWLMNQITFIQQGERIKESTEIRKKYTINETPCSLGDLVRIEQELQCAQQSLATTRKQLTLAEYEQRAREQEERAKLLYAVLEGVKKDFMSKTACFMPQIRLLKSLVFELIKEFCARTSRNNSFLLQWGSLDNEEEGVKNMKTCKEMFDFLTDLKDFLSKLMQSCPKALEDYKKHKDSYKK